MSLEQTNFTCPFCNSSRVIKHGKTSTNNLRYRCGFCHRTWVQNRAANKGPDLGTLAEIYLNGYSYRDLRSLYHSSPTRINQKIREHLLSCLPWEDYFDACVPKHESQIIHLVGKKFKCNLGDNNKHSMFLAFAIDALSTVVLGFELCTEESKEVWITFLQRLQRRGFVCPTFMSFGFKTIEDAIKTVFPDSRIFNNFTRACYDRQLKKELYYIPDIEKLILSAISSGLNKKSVPAKDSPNIFKDDRLKQIVLDSKNQFMSRLRERLAQRSTIRFEGLLRAFQNRFEKFHMIKHDPLPIINGWIAMRMLSQEVFGFSRLSLYLQGPYETRFQNLRCGNLPKYVDLPIGSPQMRTFMVELAVRALQLPVR